MAHWKKVIVSGSTANLAALQVDNLTSGQVVIGGGTAGNLSTTAINGTGTIVATTNATGLVHSGSFSGSFFGNGAGLTGVTATFPTTAKTDLTSTDQFFINDGTNKFVTYGNLLTDLAGTNLAVEGTDSLTLATTITGITSISSTNFTGSLLGNVTGTASFATYATNAGTATTASFVLNAVSASYATFAATATSASFATSAASATSASFATNAANASSASFATNAANASNATNATTAATASTVTVTDTTSGGTHFLAFTSGSSGAQTLRVDSNGPTVNPAQNSISATSFTGSLLGTATTASFVLNAVSASFATTAATATTASYVLNAVSASFATSAATATTASFANVVGSIAANVTNNTDNRVLTATGGGTINGESNLTFDGTTLTVTGNAVITNNLTVQGTASFQNTTNLEVADRFVLFASGSNTAGDGGIVVQQAIQNVGELFGYENSINRWGFTSSFNAGSPSYTAAAFVTTTEVGTTAPPAAPIYGGASNGLGNIYVRSTTEEIFIYS
jgi:hypothetical protein